MVVAPDDVPAEPVACVALFFVPGVTITEGERGCQRGTADCPHIADSGREGCQARALLEMHILADSVSASRQSRQPPRPARSAYRSAPLATADRPVMGGWQHGHGATLPVTVRNDLPTSGWRVEPGSFVRSFRRICDDDCSRRC